MTDSGVGLPPWSTAMDLSPDERERLEQLLEDRGIAERICAVGLFPVPGVDLAYRVRWTEWDDDDHLVEGHGYLHAESVNTLLHGPFQFEGF